MALVTMKSLMNHALENRYAVGYFESWNMESLLAVVDAAERTHSPVIIGFGGQFIGNNERLVEENIYHYGSLGKTVAEHAKVPVALLLNEADKVPMLIKALKAGFNAVMYQDPKVSFEETIEINKFIVKAAHCVGADVEAEVGELPSADVATGTVSGGELTDPEKAAFFVEQTGIDALAVGSIIERPVVLNGSIVARPIMNITASFDHRVIDGAVSAAFLREVKILLEKPELLLV
jgi:fructose/tagatose bisphosphate aldolase